MNMFTLSGTFLNILGQGVLLKGQSGAGKSVLALELINRSHQLIADDAVWFEKQQQQILGKCPPTIQDFMYFKEFGIINVRKIFGADAICLNTELKLVIQLSFINKQVQNLSVRSLPLKDEVYVPTSILGIAIPTLTMPARLTPAILVETAVRDLLLKAQGYFAFEELTHQQQQFLHYIPNKKL